MAGISPRGKNGKKKIKGEKKRGKVLSAEARGARDCFEKVLILEGKGDKIEIFFSFKNPVDFCRFVTLTLFLH